jgi:phospholipase A-2-activating protein
VLSLCANIHMPHLDGECIQTITHPAISVWGVAACPETGDIVSGASDRIVRVFSRDQNKWANKEVLKVGTKDYVW